MLECKSQKRRKEHQRPWVESLISPMKERKGTEVDEKIGVLSQEQVKIHFKLTFCLWMKLQALPMVPMVRKEVNDNQERKEHPR